jgi:hypothetical protein
MPAGAALVGFIADECDDAWLGGRLFVGRMSENVSLSELTPKQRLAVELIASDELSDLQIAEKLGVADRTLYRWKNLPQVQAAVIAAQEVIAEKLRLETIATKQFRIDAQVERWNALEAIRTARKADPQLSKFPGSSESGFVTAELKLVKVVDEAEDGGGISYREFWAHAFDASLWNAYLSVEKHIAQETGQWENKLAVEGTLNRELIIIHDGVEIPDDDPLIEGNDGDARDEVDE